MASLSSSPGSLQGSDTSLICIDRYGFKDVEIYNEQRLGSGAFGAVCKARCDRLPCAAKFLHPTFSLQSDSWVAEKFVQECSFLASLRHPHIVQFLGLHTDPKSGSIALLLELMDENMTTFLQRRADQLLPIHLLLDFAHDITLAMLYLHNNGIVHRDLSSNNVLLLGQRLAKVGDFGMSKLLFGTRCDSFLPRSISLTQVPGCPVYMPPEAWLTPPVYTEKLDMFSMGVLFLQMVTCREPNPGVQELLVEDDRSPTGFMKLPVSEYDRRKDDISFLPLNHPLKETILQCLEDKQKLRPSTTEICQILEDMKTSDAYRESKDNNSINVQEKSIDPSKKKLKEEEEERELEFRITRDKVVHLEEQLRTVQEQLLEKEKECSELLKEKEKWKSKKESEDKLIPITIDSLSPEVLQVISYDRESRVFNLAYKPKQGQVLFYSSHTDEDTRQSMRVFLQVYQHFFNSGELRVDFVHIPASFPISVVNKLLSVFHKRPEPSCYEHMELSSVIKIVSKTPTIHSSNMKLLKDTLSLTKDMGGGRKLTLKKGDITVEDVSVIVSAANGSLKHTWGISAAINVASGFEVQKHCDEYIAKYGAIDLGSVACTKAGGSLKCSWILHATGPAGLFIHNNEMDADTAKEMTALTHKILKKAEKLEVKSIAIPAISTGSLMLDPSTCAAGIFRGITSFSFSSSSLLTDIRVIVLKENMFLNFVECFLNLSSVEPYALSSRKKSKNLTPKAFRSGSQPDPVLDADNSPDHRVTSDSCKQS